MGLKDREVEQLGHLFGLRRGSAEGSVLRFGRRGEGDVARQARPRFVGPQHILQRNHVRGRLDPLQVEVADAVDVVEDPGQLPHHPLHFLLGETQASQSGDVKYLLALDHRRDSRYLWKLAAQPVRVPRMQGPAAERFVVLNLRLLAVTFAAVGVLFIAVPSGVLDVISDLGEWFGNDHRAPHTEQYLWLALAFAYMVVITGICLVVQADVVRYRPLLLVLAAGKTASSLASLAFFLIQEEVFIYLLNFLVDGFLALLALWLWSLVGRVGRPADPG
jgi:hypothetical protein